VAKTKSDDKAKTKVKAGEVLKPVKQPKQKSSDADIKTLVGTDAIRKRPGMYIGEPGEKGIYRMFIEGVGNVLDLFNEKACKNLFININEKTGEITISDDAYGMPLGKLDDIMTVTHTSGKFENNGFSIGMNGVGNKVINALSEKVIVIVKRDGHKWRRTFEKGKPVGKLEKLEKTSETGTTIIFKPDEEIHGKDAVYNIDSQMYLDFVEMLHYLAMGLKITFHATLKKGTEINKVLLSKNGLLDYLNSIEKNPLIKKHIFIEDAQDGKEIRVAINYAAKGDEEILLSHVNSMGTKEHGSHVQGFRMALTEVIKKYITENNLITKKEGNIEITGDDVREGLTAILELKWIEPVFDSQTKDNLTTKEAMGYVKKVVTDQLTTWLAKNKNDAKLICSKVILSAKGRMAAKRAKNNTKKEKGVFSSISNLSKFTKASLSDPKLLELFIVEGNSAGGSASQGRLTDVQSIYRLRGKPLNTHDLEALKIRSNKECSDVISILGTDIGKDFNLENLTHYKIIFMTDADIDGAHIYSLLATFFYRHMRQLIEGGYVYVAQPPLYKIRHNGKDKYIKNKEEYNRFIDGQIVETFTIAKVENGKAITMKADEVKKLLKATRRYLIDLNNVASKFALDPSLIELITITGGKDLKKLGLVIKKQFPELNANATKGGLFVEGLVGDNYQSVVINDTFFMELGRMTEIYAELKIGRFALKGKNDAKAKVVTLSELLKRVYDEATPKQRQRYKGLGEMNPEQLFETTMDPATRELIQLTIEDFEKVSERFDVLMGKNADKRKDFMAEFEIDPEDLDG
jgi:DNA gyrase subunit B